MSILKSRSATYALAVVALAIWAVIMIKIFSPKEHEVAVSHAVVQTKKDNKTDTLKLNYRDPFRPKQAVAVKLQPKNSEPVVQTPPKQRENVNFQFLGSLRYKDIQNYIVAINGIQHTLSVGDTASGFELFRAFPDSLQFRKEDLIYTVMTGRQ
jgi:hypothetical protein